MEREKTEELLRKFYDGLTSAEEDELLRDLLDAPASDGRYAPDRLLLSAGRNVVPEPSADFLKNLEAIASQAEPAKVSGRLYRYALSVAAGIAMVMGSYYVFRVSTAGEPADTFSDPELAIAEVRNILLNVSQNMNTGTGALKPINTFDRSLSRLRYLNNLNPAGEKNNNSNK